MDPHSDSSGGIQIPHPGPSPDWLSRHDEERLSYIKLVNRFYRQLRYGCCNAACKTALCSTRQKRCTSSVYRRPTQFTARAMASYLASTYNARTKLCPNTPNTTDDPDDLAFPTVKTLETIVLKGSTSTKSTTFLEESILEHPEHTSWLFKGSDSSIQSVQLPDITTETASAPVLQSKQNGSTGSVSKEAVVPKDAKSLVQMLFDTTSWKLANWVESRNGKYRLLPYERRDLSQAQEGHKDEVVSRQSRESETGEHLASFTKSNLRALMLLTHLERLSSGHKKIKWRLMYRTTPFQAEGKDCFTSAEDDMKTVLHFTTQSVVYVFNTPSALLKSFLNEELDSVAESKNDAIPSMAIAEMAHCIRALRLSAMSASVMCRPLERLLLSMTSSGHLHSSSRDVSMKSHTTSRTFGNIYEEIHVLKIALATLTSHISIPRPSVTRPAWELFVRLRQHGRLYPNDLEAKQKVRIQIDKLIGAYSSEFKMSLAKAFFHAFASLCDRDKSPILHNAQSRAEGSHTTQSSILDSSLKEFLAEGTGTVSDQGLSYAELILEWTRAVMLQDWDGKAEISRWSNAGCALVFMSHLYKWKDDIHLDSRYFVMPYFFEQIDFMTMPTDWHDNGTSKDGDHLLSHLWLFTPVSLVTFFRSINYTRMFKQHETARIKQTMVMRMSVIAASGEKQLYDRMKTAMTEFLVLEVRRSHILMDAIDQAWRREERELLRPLKVRMGMSEGEEGMDLGGVQQEFFRLLVAEILDPKYGLFAVDDRTRMAYFQPRSPAPLFYYTAVGLLIGIAIYNGLTLPVTLPLAFYRKLLDMPVTDVDHIRDGWPDLAKGLDALLTWDDGDVEDVFMRSYVFSFDFVGKVTSVNMKDPRSEPTIPGSQHESERKDDDGNEGDADMVTNSNRHEYVKDYISWLTDKSVRQQYAAFSKGFFTCVTRRSLRLFTPETLQRLVEGSQEIDVDALRRAARYEDGYDASTPIIRDFWTIVASFSPDELRHLLEFVTASDRIPARGISDMMFIIQENGDDDERLPTSMTCFGRLLLPQYSSGAILEAKLRLAIENSQGFGVA